MIDSLLRKGQRNVPLGERGFLFYAVVRDPAPTVIVLRVVRLA